jgi:hypothetical protein
MRHLSGSQVCLMCALHYVLCVHAGCWLLVALSGFSSQFSSINRFASLCFRITFSLPSFCNWDHCASLRDRLAIALNSLRNIFESALDSRCIRLNSLCNRFAMNSQSPCIHFESASKSLRNQFAIALHRFASLRIGSQPLRNRFATASHRFATTLQPLRDRSQSLRNRFAIASQSLYNCFTIALQSLCNRFTIALQSLYYRFTIALLLRRLLVAIALQSKPFCDHFVIASQSLGITSHSLCNHSELILQSLGNRSATALQ